MNIAFSCITRKVPRELQGYWDIPDRSFKRIIKIAKTPWRLSTFLFVFELMPVDLVAITDIRKLKYMEQPPAPVSCKIIAFFFCNSLGTLRVMQEKAMFNLHQSDLSSFEKFTYASFAVLNIHLLDQYLYLSNCASKTYQIIKLWVITSFWSTTQLWWALFTASIAFLQFK